MSELKSQYDDLKRSCSQFDDATSIIGASMYNTNFDDNRSFISNKSFKTDNRPS